MKSVFITVSVLLIRIAMNLVAITKKNDHTESGSGEKHLGTIIFDMEIYTVGFVVM